MILFKLFGRGPSANGNDLQRLTALGRTFRAQFPMAANDAPFEVPALTTSRLRATWSRNPVTGALECRWDAEPFDDEPRKAVGSRNANDARIHRLGIHAGMCSSPRCAHA